MIVPRVLLEGFGDISADVVFPETELVNAAQGEPSPSRLVLRDLGPVVRSFITGARVTVDIAGTVIWAGYLLKASRQFWFDVDKPNTMNRRIVMMLVDLNILFGKRIVFKQASPKTFLGPVYRSPTYDDTIITELLDNWLDLSADDLDTTTLVERVAIVNPSSGACDPADQSFYPFNGSMRWGEAMTVIGQIPAAIFGLLPGEPLGTSPFGRLFYVDVDNEDAPLDLSDIPGAGRASYREMTIWRNGAELVNDDMAWGAGKGDPNMVFDRRIDSASVTDHGLWQQGDILFNIWCQDTIEKVTDSVINGSPTSRRGHRNDILSVELITFEDGFRIGQKARFLNAGYAIDEILPIRKATITFPTKTSRQYQLLLSEALDLWGWEDPLPPFKGLGGGGDDGGGGIIRGDCGHTDIYHRVVASGAGVSDAKIAYVEWDGYDDSAPAPSSGLSYSVDGTGLVITATDVGTEWGSIDLPLPISQFDALIRVQDYIPGYLNGAINLQMPGTSAAAYVAFTTTPNFQLRDGGGNDIVSFSYDGRPFWVRISYTDTTTRAKIWYVGDAEPDWQVERPAGDHTVQAAISYEFDGFATNGDSVKISYLSVRSLADDVSLLGAPLFDNFQRIETAGWGTSTPSGQVWSGSGVTSSQESNVLGEHGRLWVEGSLDGGGSNIQEVPVPDDLQRPFGIIFKINFRTPSDTSIPLAFRGAGDTPNAFINLYLDGATSGEVFVGFTLGDGSLDALAQTVSVQAGGDDEERVDFTPSQGVWYYVELRRRVGGLELRVWPTATARPLAPLATAPVDLADPFAGSLSFHINHQQVNNVGSSASIVFPEYEVWFKDLAFLGLNALGPEINRCYLPGDEAMCWRVFDDFNRTVAMDSWGDASSGPTYTRGPGPTNGHSYVNPGAGVMANGGGVFAIEESEEVDFGITPGSNFEVLVSCGLSSDTAILSVFFVIDQASVVAGWDHQGGDTILFLQGAGGIGRTTVSFPPDFWATVDNYAVFKIARRNGVLAFKLFDIDLPEPGWQVAIVAGGTPAPGTLDQITASFQSSDVVGGQQAAFTLIRIGEPC